MLFGEMSGAGGQHGGGMEADSRVLLTPQVINPHPLSTIYAFVLNFCSERFVFRRDSTLGYHNTT